MNRGDVDFILFIIALAGLILTGILFVVFTEVTGRRLRKNPKTKDKLGVEFVSGSNVIGVAQALSLPRWITRRSDKSYLGLLPNSKLIYNHTTKLDRMLGRLFYWTMIVTVIAIAILIVMTY